MQETPVICSIATASHLAQARCLAKSFIEHHPDGRIFVLLLDVMGYYLDPSLDNFTVVLIEDLQIEQYESMLQKYSDRDLAISLKPFLIQYIFKRYDYRKVCWFDSDIYIYRSLKESVWDKLDNYPIIVTPHLLQPLDKYDLPRELLIAVAGIYNSGFIGLCRHEDVNKFLEWWKIRLEDHCYSNPAGGLTRDQRWLDFLPTLGLNLHISRDPGLNLGHWDLHNRFIEKTDGGYTVNGAPLSFFHFSGYSEQEPDVISKHILGGVTFEQRPDVKPIFDIYQNSLVYFKSKEENVNQMLMKQLKVTEMESSLSKAQEELEVIKCQLHQTQSELEQSQAQLQQTQGELDQSHTQLHQTQSELEQSQAQLHQTQSELEQSQAQLHQTQSELEQSQAQLHQTHSELEQSQAQLHQTHSELEQSQAQLHQTHSELEQSQAQLQQTQGELEQSQAQLQQTQGELEQSQAQLQQTQDELDESQTQLQQTQSELEQSQAQLHQTQSELDESQTQLHQTQSELDESQTQLHQTQSELDESQTQLHQTQSELDESQTQLHQTQSELDESQTQLHQTQSELDESQTQLHQTQDELERLRFQQAIVRNLDVQDKTQYTMLLWDGWYAYHKSDLKEMAQFLKESLKYTPFSPTETVLNWLENFARFSSEKGVHLDTYSLVNSAEWKELIRRSINSKHSLALR